MDYAERRLGRRLIGGEKYLDLVGIDRDLRDGKAALRDALEAEKLRAIKDLADGGGVVPLQVTAELENVMAAIVAAGMRHAETEIAAMGVELPRLYDEEFDRRLGAKVREIKRRGMIQRFAALLDRGLNAIFLRARDETVGLELGGLAQDKLAEEVEKRVPGTLDLASRLVSGLFDTGLADVYERAQEFFPCWRYSAVLDAATCAPCRRLDSTEYETLAGLYAVLPNFGPNPLCLGDGRCRCRGVPCPPSEAPATPFEGPKVYKPSELIDNQIRRPLVNRDVDRAMAALDKALGDIVTPDQVQKVKMDVEQPTRSSLGSTRAGGYESQRILGGSEIRTKGIFLNLYDAERDTTVIHEFGHFFDQMIIGRGRGRPNDGGFASMKIVFGNDDMLAGAEYTDLLQSIVNSGYVRELLRLKDDPASFADLVGADREKVARYLAYYTDPTELFARAFTQYVVEKADDEKMLDWIRSTDSTGPRALPLHWTASDFAQIRAKFDLLLEALVRYSYR